MEMPSPLRSQLFRVLLTIRQYVRSKDVYLLFPLGLCLLGAWRFHGYLATLIHSSFPRGFLGFPLLLLYVYFLFRLPRDFSRLLIFTQMTLLGLVILPEIPLLSGILYILVSNVIFLGLSACIPAGYFLKRTFQHPDLELIDRIGLAIPFGLFLLKGLLLLFQLVDGYEIHPMEECRVAGVNWINGLILLSGGLLHIRKTFREKSLIRDYLWLVMAVALAGLLTYLISQAFYYDFLDLKYLFFSDPDAPDSFILQEPISGPTQ